VVALRVALDTSPLRLTRAGTARYIRALLDRIDVLEPVAFGGPGRAAVLARELWWYPLRLSLLGGADVVHCPTYYGPIRPRSRSVVTVHDLAVWRHPEAFGEWTRRYVPRVVPAVLRAAARIVAVSEFTAGELERVLGVARERVTVIPNAADAAFSADGPHADGEYVLAVGTLEPRKNLDRAIRAAERLGVELRVVGERGWGGVEAAGPHVRWLGRLDDEQLAAQYRGAHCLVFPSLYEGFGIPILEAMACGTPVVTSGLGAMREIADDAAILVDPLDIADIAAGIERAASEHARLREAGLARARQFSWDESARRTRDVYDEAAA
jgi:glycosyltransferase involved in cell wall biosynthesis